MMKKDIYSLEIDEGLEHVMPPLSDLELELLTESLLTEGCRDPLVVWDGKIVDGHNRYRICKENNVPFGFVEMSFDDFSAAKIWIIRNQLARRNVPDYVRVELVLPLEAELKAEAKKRQGARNDLKNIPPDLAGSTEQGDTRDTLAGLAGVSHGTFSKAKKIINEADEETKEKLRNGEISIHGAYTALKPKEGPITPPPEKTWGDIVPGYGIEQILANGEKEDYVCPPDYVRYLAPMSMGWPEEENMDFEKAESCVEDAKQYFFHRMEYILQMISDDCINEENIAKLSDSISKGYEQIMKMLKEELGGKKHE